MTSTVIQIRLRPDELACLDKLRSGYNRSEYLRYLLVAEHDRRSSGRRPNMNRFMSDMRHGRPKKEAQATKLYDSFAQEALQNGTE